MKIYRIQNKQTGLYFVHAASPADEGYWNNTGQFFKRIDTIAKHLDHLFHEWNLERKGLFSWQWVRGNFLSERKGIFQVVVNDITVNNETTYDAEKFVKERAG